MAAGINWKRPWEDDNNVNTGLPRLQEEALLPNAISLQAPQELDHEPRLARHRGFPPITRNSTPAVLSPSPHRYVGLSARSGETACEAFGSHVPDVPFYKRRRVDNLQSLRRHSMNILSTRNDVQGICFPLRDTSVENSIGYGSDRELSTLPNTAGVAMDVGTHHAEELEGLANELKGKGGGLTGRVCHNCGNTDQVLQRIVLGLVQINAEVSSVLTSDLLEHSSFSDLDQPHQAIAASQDGLQRTLDWVLESVHSTSRMAKDLVISQSRLSNFLESLPLDEHINKPSTASNEKARRRCVHPERVPSDTFPNFHPHDENGFQSFAISNPTATSRDEHRTSIFQELPASQMPPSPHPTAYTSTSALIPSQSPVQAPPSSRLLPSPSSLNFSSSSHILPPISPSILSGQSPHTAHLQDLQHQISTKSLALQILQREHDKLLAAFQRSQTRCATLDMKFQVSDAEINNLAEERIKLQERIEFLETQVEELQQSRDDVHKQSVAKGGQYMKIMAMSSKLQAQGASDFKKWKFEKDAWQQEKAQLLSKVAELEREKGALAPPRSAAGTSQKNSPNFTSTSPDTPNHAAQSLVADDTDDAPNNSSLEILREEIKRLRVRCRNMENALLELRTESEHIDDCIERLGGIGKRIRIKGPGSESTQHSMDGSVPDVKGTGNGGA